MLKILNKIRKVGIITEDVSRDASLESLGIEVKRHVDKIFSGSFAIREVDAGSCNGCELEVHALNNAYYDVERFGVHFVASPRHADALLVTMGDCTINGGEFGVSYASVGGVEKVIPVDVVIAGCPPTPQALLHGILALFRKVE